MSDRTQKKLAIISIVSALLAGLAGPSLTWALLLLPAWSLALLIVPRLRDIRPSRPLVRSGMALSLVAGAIFITSMLLKVEVAASPSEVWKIGGAGISRTIYRTRTPRYPGAPQVTVSWDPRPIPFGASFVAIGDMADGSSREESRA